MLKKISKQDGAKKLQGLNVRHTECAASEPVTAKNIDDLITGMKKKLGTYLDRLLARQPRRS